MEGSGGEEGEVSQVISIDGFRCTNHSPSRHKLATGRFDAYNPCSWCENRKHKGKKGPSFHYVEFGHWEFPFIAESNCDNFSFIALANTAQIDPVAWSNAVEIQKQRNKIAVLGRKYSARDWTAFSPDEVPDFMGTPVEAGAVRYPYEMSPPKFFREANSLRSDLYELLYDLREVSDTFKKQMGIRETRIDTWLSTMSTQLGNITKQIDEVEIKGRKSGFAIFSNWAFNTVSGGVAWDGLKTISRIVGELLRG